MISIKDNFFAMLVMCFAVGSVFFSSTVQAESKPVHTQVPRFVSLSVDEVNMRAGPGFRYPVRLVLRRKNMPVEVIREFDIWRQIRDIDGDRGWVHKNMLSSSRAVVIKEDIQIVLKEPAADASPVVKLEPDVVAALKKCQEKWCVVEVGGYEGWLPRRTLWGVYPDEVFKD